VSARDLGVAVVGAEGRLGRFACALIEAQPGLRLVARLGRGAEVGPRARAAGATLAFEATRAGSGYANARALLAHGVRPLVATSGVTDAELAALDGQARELGLGGLVVPNFSLGILLLQRAAEAIARHVPAVEILELHHERKHDAPSGTARASAARLEALRPGPVPIHSVRLPGLYAHQAWLFGAAGETLTLRHDMHGPEAFGPGILAGLAYLPRALGVARGLEHALDLG